MLDPLREPVGEPSWARTLGPARAQLRAVLHLGRSLPKQLLTRGEHAEELVIEVVAVGDDDDGRVLWLRDEDEFPGKEGHSEAPSSTPAGNGLLYRSDQPFLLVTGFLLLPAGSRGKDSASTRTVSGP